jgi:hypothetical protein
MFVRMCYRGQDGHCLGFFIFFKDKKIKTLPSGDVDEMGRACSTNGGEEECI